MNQGCPSLATGDVAGLMHPSTDTTSSLGSSQTAEGLNDVPNKRANRQQPLCAEDIFGDLNNHIPVGTVTVDLRISVDGHLVKWPSRDEWQECDSSRSRKLLGRYEGALRPFDVLLSDRVIRVFGRRHPRDPQKGIFRVYGKIHENVPQTTRQ